MKKSRQSGKNDNQDVWILLFRVGPNAQGPLDKDVDEHKDDPTHAYNNDIREMEYVTTSGLKIDTIKHRFGVIRRMVKAWHEEETYEKERDAYINWDKNATKSKKVAGPHD